MRMAIRTEISLRLPNSPGELQRICALLDTGRVSLMALHLESSGRLRIVTDNPLHASGVLTESGHHVEERDVIYVLLPNKPGSLLHISRLLCDAGVNLEYAYAAAVEGSPMAALVIGVADAQRAASLAGL
jgi:hypothetical protein